MQYFGREYQATLEELFRSGYQPTLEDKKTAKSCTDAYSRNALIGATIGAAAVYGLVRAVPAIQVAHFFFFLKLFANSLSKAISSKADLVHYWFDWVQHVGWNLGDTELF